MRAWKRLAGSLGLIAVLWLAPSAAATTATIGQVAPAGTTGSCGACSELQLLTAPGTTSYAVPALPASGNPWTLTAWSARASTAAGGSARALVWRPTGTPGEFRLVAATGDATFPAGQAPTVAASIPVQPGDVLGLRTGDSEDVPAVYDSPSAEDEELAAVGDPVIGQTTGAPTSDVPSFVGQHVRVNVSATLTSPDVAPSPITKRKCKKHKRKRSAESAKKKHCKKKHKK
jgi:hypothetical protein